MLKALTLSLLIICSAGVSIAGETGDLKHVSETSGALKEFDAKVEANEADMREIREMGTEGMCSLGCAVGWDIEVSSFLPPQGANGYGSTKVNDSDIETAWVEGKDGYGVGEYVIFRFPRAKFIGDNEVSFWGLRIVNGYCKNEQTWKANSRIKKVKLYLKDKPLYIINVQDTMYLQEVSFNAFMIKSDDWVKVEILEVYPGDKYKDTAISELEPLGAH